jgi:hypothetical protein
VILILGYSLDVHCDAPREGLSVDQLESLINDYWNFLNEWMSAFALSNAAIAEKYGVSETAVRRIVKACSTLTIETRCLECSEIIKLSVTGRSALQRGGYGYCCAACNAWIDAKKLEDCDRFPDGAREIILRQSDQPHYTPASSTLTLTADDKKFLRAVGVKMD